MFYHERRALTLRHARRKMGHDAFVRDGLHEWEAWHVESIGFFARERMAELVARNGYFDTRELGAGLVKVGQ